MPPADSCGYDDDYKAIFSTQSGLDRAVDALAIWLKDFTFFLVKRSISFMSYLDGKTVDAVVKKWTCMLPVQTKLISLTTTLPSRYKFQRSMCRTRVA